MSITHKCSVDNCNSLGKLSLNGKRYLIKGYCSKHYGRYIKNIPILDETTKDKRHAIIEGEIAKIPIGLKAKSGYLIVDKDFAYLDKYSWHLNPQGYAVARTKDRRLTRAHHLIISKPESPFVIDHINRKKLDNRKENLRVCTMSQNMANRGSNSKTGMYKGVTKKSSHSKNAKKVWYATVFKDGKKVWSKLYELLS